MKIKSLFTAIFWFTMLALSCSRDEIGFHEPSGKLLFSADTVVLDTVFNQVRTETYAVKLYNTESKDIRIPKIYLENRSASLYRINVDGKAGFEFSDVPLRAKDSLYVFVEMAPDISSTEIIAEEKLYVESSIAKQYVTLLSVVKDAEFFVSTQENPKVITQNTTWTADKAKIIYGDLEVAAGKIFTIEGGTHLYFNKGATLSLKENSRLLVTGSLGKEVVFRGARNDARYDTLPLNWQGIKMAEGSILKMNYGRIFGGETGISLNKSTAEISNSIIHTFQKFGILSTDSHFRAENLVMNNFGESALALYGGKYEIIHSTIANYWEISPMPALGIFASNMLNGKNTPLDLQVSNSIVYTQNANAAVFRVEGSGFNYKLENNLIKYDQGTAGFSWDGNPNVLNSLKNVDPRFLNRYVAKMNLRVAADSQARGKGNLPKALQVPVDIAGVSRTVFPTIGAYQ